MTLDLAFVAISLCTLTVEHRTSNPLLLDHDEWSAAW